MVAVLASCELFTSPKSSPTTLGPTAVAGGFTFTQIVAGDGHSCGLTTAGKAYCWGYNSTRNVFTTNDVATGQLGDSTPNDSQTPVAVAGGLTFTQLTAGAFFTCGLTGAGAAYCWGANRNELISTNEEPVFAGNLGDATAVNRFHPVAVVGGKTFTSISAGWFHTCGLSGGAAYCWGNGGLGTGDSAVLYTPTAVTGGLTFQSLSSGGVHTCALTSAGAAYCWGQNIFGQVGDNSFAPRLSPSAVAGGLTFTSIVASGGATCGTVAGGSIYCWGSNALGGVGDGTTTNRSVPTKISTTDQLSGLVVGSLAGSQFLGSNHGCGLTSTGQARCWGNNNAGQLGIATLLAQLAPTPVNTELKFRSLAAGGLHTCGVTASGTAYCWGARYVVGAVQ
jgi:alpha-tubulin suppressor-like RCC1 family protein